MFQEILADPLKRVLLIVLAVVMIPAIILFVRLWVNSALLRKEQKQEEQ